MLNLKLFYHLITRRDLITKLNITNSSFIPKVDSIVINYVMGHAEQKEQLAHYQILSIYCLFEKLFNQRVFFRKTNYFKKIGFGRKLKRMYDLCFLISLRKDLIYDFIYKLIIFMPKDQKKYYNESKMNFFIENLKVEEEVLLQRKKISSIIEEFSRKVSNAEFKNKKYWNSSLIRWDNFDFFLNLLEEFNYFNSDLDLGDEKRIYLRFNSESINSTRELLLLLSSLRVLEYFKVLKHK